MLNTNPPSLKRLGQAAAALVLSHIELIGIELSEEKSRLTRIAVLAAICLVSVLLMLFAASAWVLIYFWDTHRLLAASALTGFFVLVLLISFWRLKQQLSLGANAFSATREELAKHRDLLP